MPVLKDYRTIKEVVLPITKAKVSLLNSLMTGEAEQVSEMTGSDMVKARKMLSMLIVKWDLTNEANEVLPHSEENLLKIPLNDLNVMIKATDYYEEVLSEKKK